MRETPAVSVLPKDVSQEVFGILERNNKEVAGGLPAELPKGD